MKSSLILRNALVAGVTACLLLPAGAWARDWKHHSGQGWKHGSHGYGHSRGHGSSRGYTHGYSRGHKNSGFHISFNSGFNRHYGGFDRYRHHYGFGHRVTSVPRSAISFHWGGNRFYYSSGLFYRPYYQHYTVVRPPTGITVTTLPSSAGIIYANSRRYHVYNDTFYEWDPGNSGYVVVSDPRAANTGLAAAGPATVDTSVFVYPNHGQGADQTARDRYECYGWAVDETGFDPSRPQQPPDAGADDYVRALSACMEARGYTVR